MRRSLASVAAALLLLSLPACDRRVWTGPLAAAGDSLFPAAPTAGCDATDLAFERARPPLRSCRVVRGDTTFALLSDSERKLLVLGVGVKVDPLRQMEVHDSIQFAVAMQYEAPAICPDGGDALETEVRRWNTLDRQIVLKNVGEDEVWLELRSDHPKCPEGS